MPWTLAIEAQRARLGRRKVSSNIFKVFFWSLVGGFVPLVGGFVLDNLTWYISRAIPLF